MKLDITSKKISYGNEYKLEYINDKDKKNNYVFILSDEIIRCSNVRSHIDWNIINALKNFEIPQEKWAEIRFKLKI